jgi:hypothetical protein
MGLHAMSFDRSAIEIDLARRATNAGRLSRLATALMMVVTSIALSGCLEDTPAATASAATGTNTPVAATVENRSSALSGVPATTVAAGEAYRFVPQASDPDGDVLTFSIQNAPSWGTFDTATGVLAGAPAAVNVGTSSSILISVSDGVLVTSLPAFSIQVTSATTPAPTPTGNTPPTVSGVPSTAATVGAAYVFQPSASDSDGNTLTFSIVGKPAWGLFSTSTGRLSGAPTATGTFPGISISVSDGTTSVSLPTYSIVVKAVANRAPEISGTPATSVVAGAAYSFQPTASDADGNTIGFSIANKPSWASFSTTTGRLSGTPTLTAVHSGIVVSVSDGTVTTALPTFTLTVTGAANRAPTISGTPATSIAVGATYAFSPVTSDADGDALTFTIASKPAWATFSTSTGQLSGIPAVGDVGAFSGVTISVSDGKTSAALATFSITVTQVATGSATLSWVAPTQNTDGSALTNLSGYRIYYGTSAASLPQSVDIPNVGIQTYMLGNLSPATWYFAVRAVAGGVESDISNVASKTIT